MKLFGETIGVKAEIRKLDGISGHADNKGLMEWIGAFGKTPRHVFVLHGDDEITELFAGRVQSELGLKATAPYNGESWDLTQDLMLKEGNKIKIRHEHATPMPQPKQQPKPEQPEREEKRESAAYERLLEAGGRMQALISQMARSSKKNQKKLASALFSLAKRYQKR